MSWAMRGLILATFLTPLDVCLGQPGPEDRQQRIERELQEIRAMRADLGRQMGALDARMEALELELKSDTPASTPTVGIEALTPSLASPAQPPQEPRLLEGYRPGRGLVLAEGPQGALDLSIFSYVRYINQTELADSYTDAFGRTSQLDLRQDFQLQKVTLNFKGWLFDERFRYLFYVWTANTSLGQSSQVVVGGNLNYRFNRHLTVGGGIGALPSTRTTNNTFPNWLKVDHRTIGDEFFRGSFTTGVWASGELVDRLSYRVMVGNNLSQFGIDAGQLDASISTFSGALWWMPTTGEYGPAAGYGDYEHHERPATLFGVHFTHSREDAEEQPGVNDFENVQLRLSDGTRIFAPRAFATDGQIRRASYDMLAVNAGVKYRGWSLDGEYYFRWLGDFRTIGTVPVDKLYDHGFQLQASKMLAPRRLQAYVAGSKVFGEFGNPSDLSVGVNWYPLARPELRFNAQALYLDRSPVGATSLPYVVGGDGWLGTIDLVLAF